MTVMPLPLVEDEDFRPTVVSLSRKLERQERRLAVVDRYYTGDQPISFVAPEVRRQVGNRLTTLVINWPRTIIDSVQRRTYVEGFRVGDSGEVDAELWRIWQANDLDEWSQLGHVDALVHGRAFILVWGNDEDPETPRITVESAHQMAVDYAPGTGQVRAALKRWADDGTHYATLYLPEQVLRYRAPVKSRQAPVWALYETIDNPLGVVPVVPLVNRPRVLDLDGESELADVLPLADAVNKLATDMMVTSEFHASKRRYATGIQIPPGPGGRERTQAEAEQWWDNATKGKTWLAGPNVNFGQFDEASLENFVNAIRLLTGQIAAIAGLPPHYLGVNTDNPASADAIRSAESTLVERAREKMRTWGGAYERVMRMAVASRDGVRVDALPGELKRMETVWRDPETPTVAQSADAAVKLHQAGIIDDVAAQERVRLSPQERDAIAARAAAKMTSAAGPKFQDVGLPALVEANIISLEEARRMMGFEGDAPTSSPATADVEARMDLARRLVREDGLSLNAAMAAVGLLVAAARNAAESA